VDTRRRRLPSILLALGGLVLIVVIAFALSLAAEAGRLPWQGEPTRVPVVPFSDLPTVAPAGTPAP
jgi:MFS superfamily sulfate permease-like transporter